MMLTVFPDRINPDWPRGTSNRPYKNQRSSCGANQSGGGGFLPGNDCAGGGSSGGMGESSEGWQQRYDAHREAQAEEIEGGVANIMDDADNALHDALNEGLTAGLLVKYRESMDAVLNRMSPKMLQKAREHIKDFEFMGDPLEVTERAGTVSGRNYLEEGKIVSGYWREDMGRVVLDGDMSTIFDGMPSREHSYAHELAHGYDGGFSDSGDWKAAWSSEIDIDSTPLNKYSRTNPSEGFAEFMVLATKEPAKARKKYPKSWAAVSNEYELEPK